MLDRLFAFQSTIAPAWHCMGTWGPKNWSTSSYSGDAGRGKSVSNSLGYLSMASSVADNGGDASTFNGRSDCLLDDRTLSLVDKSHLEAPINIVGNQDFKFVLKPSRLSAVKAIPAFYTEGYYNPAGRGP